MLGLAVSGMDLPIWLAYQAADIEGTSNVGQIGSDGSHSHSCTVTKRSQGSASVAVAVRPNLCEPESLRQEDVKIARNDDFD